MVQSDMFSYKTSTSALGASSVGFGGGSLERKLENLDVAALLSCLGGGRESPSFEKDGEDVSLVGT